MILSLQLPNVNPVKSDKQNGQTRSVLKVSYQ